MLMASDGFTMPVLEAILETELQVRVLRQDDIGAARLPAAVVDALRLVESTDRVIVRRSCLIDPDLKTVSVNHVVTVAGAADASAAADVNVPIGHSLMSRGVSQRRQILRTGLARWLDGRPCAAKAYVITLRDRPLCYIREWFNPAVIDPAVVAADHTHPSEGDLHWRDEPEYPEAESIDLSAAAPPRWEDEPLPPEPQLQQSIARLRALPPLVHPDECETLTTDLAAASHGEAFVLHLGDGAETRHVFDSGALASRRAMLHAAAAVLQHGLGTRVVPVGRLAGSYVEPVSNLVDDGGGGPPGRWLEAYYHAAAALNDVRGSQPPTALGARILSRVADQCLDRASGDLLREVAGLLPMAAAAPAASHELYSSISRLHFSQEAHPRSYGVGLMRRGPNRHWWDCSTQLLCLGDRAGDVADEHIRYAAAVRNPIAVALGPAATPRDVRSLCLRLNPENRPGRLTLVLRPGTASAFSALFEAAAACGTPVCWVCDPLHADTPLHNGRRGRLVEVAVAGVRAFVEACRATRTVPGGLHLDWTPEADGLHSLAALLPELRAV
jgi:3-deoxy-D-arabino-heptulosonate 7-phosphate (DAHP) synthase class II